MEKDKKIKNVFREGPLPADMVATTIANHQSKTNIGAHDIFLGQVRADIIDGKTVAAIEYTAYEEMANQLLHELKEEAHEKFDITCVHIYHSLGVVESGELCLFIMTSAAHRAAARESMTFIVESLKAKAPIFGKEIFEDASHQWKVNK